MAKYRIAFDGNEANLHNRVGVNEYAFQVLNQLEKMTRKKDIEITVLLSTSPIDSMPSVRPSFSYEVIRPARFWTQWAASWYLLRHRSEFDVYYTPSHYLPRYCPIPSIVTIHDLAFLEYPNHFKVTDFVKLKNWTKDAVNRASMVLAVSNFTKNDLINTYSVRHEQIDLASPALNLNHARPLKREQNSILQHFNIKGEFLLYVGTLQPRKNLVRLVKAFDQLVSKKKYKDYSLVLAGKTGWLTQEIIQEIATAKNSDKIVLTGFVTEKEKWCFYSQAKAIVLPGFYEGFGMPALEAMSVGTLPVVSKTGSLKEVVGKAGVIIDPYSTASIQSGMEKAINLKPKELKQFQQRMKNRVVNYSWSKTANTVLMHLKKVVDER